jgi:SNF2 family DNA or RNA helicase
MWVWGMTGSPRPQAPTDVYGIAKLINPTTSPVSFVRFRDEVMIRVSQFKWDERKDASETIAKILQPSVAFTLEDVAELPPLIERQIDVEQGKRQRDAYKTMSDHCALWLKEGAITAANGGVVLSKLLQIACGYVYADGRKPVTLDNDMRLETVLDIIDNTDRKAIVFCPYLHAVAGLASYLAANHVDFAVVTGEVPHEKRGDIFNRFQNTAQIKVLVAHPQCMSHGLNLQAADTIVWFAPIHSLEIFEQANARIRRVGQKHKQQVFMLQGTRAERLVYQSLRTKRAAQESVLDILADLTETTT